VTIPRRAITSVLVLAVLVPLAPLASRAATSPPYDFTGHWTGMAQETGNPATVLVGDLSRLRGNTFDGTFTASGTTSSQCMVTLRVKRTLKLKMRISCDNGTKINAQGMVEPSTQTVSATYTRKGRHGNTHQGTITITKQSA
jgi:hypothetical protein